MINIICVAFLCLTIFQNQTSVGFSQEYPKR